MRSVLKQFAIYAALMLLGIGVMGYAPQGPWLHIGIGLIIFPIVFSIGTLGDAICIALRHFGRPADKDAVMVHVYAAVALLMALVFGFVDDDPRLAGMRWFLLVFMPLSVYVVSYILDWIFSGDKKK